MSKDVLKTLQSNYNKDCKDQEGNYYNPAITSAIQGVIQRITGSRPKASFGLTPFDIFFLVLYHILDLLLYSIHLCTLHHILLVFVGYRRILNRF